MNKEELLEEEVTASLVEGSLPCAVAFKVARKLQVTPRVVGDVADTLGIRIVNCQLGCFIVEKAVHGDVDSLLVSETVMGRVKSSLIDGRLSCPAAFKVSRELKVARQEVGDAANKLRVKIVSCQLSCFE
ncbi:MAG: hypothetical protein HY667_02680 [Chloroflexi bacterium]|nr:hypothetical protein [Chloroflexota bacterium]